ncbi:DUF2510 domain-containing protein [Galbitalea soli]|uniref:DUF2510 domain-containing protein n=1 Tax=Galbitalea soli TaxID=1268042 RepID=A0A7C9PLL1_9MICO|nr:DUF2510 domain-containing protein [Galbitalea soli]NEM90111.1 DUF2510 domain-containing protein [Galbitalea soli]NYJ30818.1 hypothetical protein [Galbitalea soli]
MVETNTLVERLAAGWYPDPDGELLKRWWNGTEWTSYVHEYDPLTELFGEIAEPGTPWIEPRRLYTTGELPARHIDLVAALPVAIVSALTIANLVALGLLVTSH